MWCQQERCGCGPTAVAKADSLRILETSSIRAQLGAKRERNTGHRVQYTEIQRVHSGKNNFLPDWPQTPRNDTAQAPGNSTITNAGNDVESEWLWSKSGISARQEASPRRHPQPSKSKWGAIGRRRDTSKHVGKNINFGTEVCRTPTKHSKWAPWAVCYDPSRLARNKATSPTQHPPIPGYTWWAHGTRWSNLPRNENRSVPVYEASYARDHTWNKSGNCSVNKEPGKPFTGMNAQIGDKVKNCTTCHDYAPAQQKKLLMPRHVPDLPWGRAL